MRLKVWVSLALVGLLFSLGCAPMGGGLLERQAFALPTGTASFRLAPYRAATITPTATPVPTPAPRECPLVWAGGEGRLTMLSPQGWQVFEVQGIVRDIAIDPQGNAIVAPGLRTCDGQLVRDLLPPAPGGEQDAVAIDPQGRIWVGYYGGIAVLDGGRWREIAFEGVPDLGQATVVRDLAIDHEGVAWVATDAGLARYDGASWRLFGERTGLGASLADCVMVDPQGRVWVGHEKGLSMLAGNSWQHFPLDIVSFVRGLATDASGRTLAGSLYHGLSLFDGSLWTPYAGLDSGLPSERVTALQVDALGRIWAGTRYGLAVLDGERWLSYQEANSGLGDNQVSALAIGGGALPSLPAPEPPRYGRLVGRVTLDSRPLFGVRVVLCSELSLAQGFDDNPAEAAPFSRTTHTGADGSFAFEEVPAGHYAVAAEVEPGRWAMRTRVVSAVRYLVRAGETTVIETIEGAE